MWLNVDKAGLELEEAALRRHQSARLNIRGGGEGTEQWCAIQITRPGFAERRISSEDHVIHFSRA